MSPETARGRLEALRRIAEEGDTHGWDHVPDLLALHARIVAGDARRAGPYDEFETGWARATVECSDFATAAGIESLAPWVHRLLLDAGSIEG